MSSKITVLVLLCATSALSQTASEVCARIPYADTKVACIRAISGHQVAPEAAAVCGSIPYADQVVRCLTGALDKFFDTGTLEACSSIPYADKKSECVSAAGRVRTRREVVRDDDDDDRRDDGREVASSITFENRTNQVVIKRCYWRQRGGAWTEFPGRRTLRGGSEATFSAFEGRYDLCAQTNDGRSVLWKRIDVGESGHRVYFKSRDFEDGDCLDR